MLSNLEIMETSQAEWMEYNSLQYGLASQVRDAQNRDDSQGNNEVQRWRLEARYTTLCISAAINPRNGNAGLGILAKNLIGQIIGAWTEARDVVRNPVVVAWEAVRSAQLKAYQ